MKKLFVSSLLGATVTLSVAGTAQAFSVKVNGSGCPVSAGEKSYWDGDELVIPLGEMVVQKGSQASPADKRKNCAITLSTDGDWRLAIKRIRATGYGDLKAGDSLKLSFDRFIQGEGRDFPLSFVSQGDKDNIIDFSYSLRPSEQVWTTCKPTRALTMNTAFLLQGDSEDYARAELDELRIRIDADDCDA